MEAWGGIGDGWGSEGVAMRAAGRRDGSGDGGASDGGASERIRFRCSGRLRWAWGEVANSEAEEARGLR
jgi:hypothetical protein